MDDWKVSLKPYGNTIDVTITLPWDIAFIVAEHGPRVVEQLQAEVTSHKNYKISQAEAAARTTEEQQKTRDQTRELAEEIEAEIARRSNGPGDCRSILKQIAAEKGITVDFARIVTSVLRKEQKKKVTPDLHA